MAGLPTNTFATYEAVGNREDLSDMIYRIDPTETPFMSGIARETATAVNHEWQTQALAQASGSNAQLEGDDIAADADIAASIYLRRRVCGVHAERLIGRAESHRPSPPWVRLSPAVIIRLSRGPAKTPGRANARRGNTTGRRAAMPE